MPSPTGDELLSEAHSRTVKLVSALQSHLDDLHRTQAFIAPNVAEVGITRLSEALSAAGQLGRVLESIGPTHTEGE